jgi:hypothetical protein
VFTDDLSAPLLHDVPGLDYLRLPDGPVGFNQNVREAGPAPSMGAVGSSGHRTGELDDAMRTSALGAR